MQNIQMYKILIVNMVINMTDHTIPSKLLELRQRYYSFIQIWLITSISSLIIISMSMYESPQPVGA